MAAQSKEPFSSRCLTSFHQSQGEGTKLAEAQKELEIQLGKRKRWREKEGGEEDEECEEGGTKERRMKEMRRRRRRRRRKKRVQRMRRVG